MDRDPDLAAALTAGEAGLYLEIEVTPQSKVERFPDGYDPWRRRVGVRVAAPPQDGRANRAVCTLIAKRLGIPARAVTIVRGATASTKTVHLSGISRAEVLHRLQEALV